MHPVKLGLLVALPAMAQVGLSTNATIPGGTMITATPPASVTATENSSTQPESTSVPPPMTTTPDSTTSTTTMKPTTSSMSTTPAKTTTLVTVTSGTTTVPITTTIVSTSSNALSTEIILSTALVTQAPVDTVTSIKVVGQQTTVASVVSSVVPTPTSGGNLQNAAPAVRFDTTVFGSAVCGLVAAMAVMGTL